MRTRKISVVLFVAAVVITVGVYLKITSEQTQSETPENLEIASPQADPSHDPVSSEIRTPPQTDSTPQTNDSASATTTSANVALVLQMGQLFASDNLAHRPSAEVIAQFKSMGFEFTERQSGNPSTGSRKVLDLSAPHAGFTRLQIQYAEGDGREVLEGIRFTTDPGQYKTLVEQTIRESTQIKIVENTPTNAVFFKSDGYTIWLKVFDEKNPPPQGGPANVMNGGFEPGVD